MAQPQHFQCQYGGVNTRDVSIVKYQHVLGVCETLSISGLVLENPCWNACDYVHNHQGLDVAFGYLLPVKYEVAYTIKLIFLLSL